VDPAADLAVVAADLVCPLVGLVGLLAVEVSS